MKNQLLVESAEFKTFVISLKTQTERRSVFEENQAWLDFCYFDAVDARNMHIPFLSHIEKTFGKNDFSIGAFGCLLSHRSLWKNLLQGSESAYIIFEDDVVISKKRFEHWTPIIRDLDFDVLFLGSFWGRTVPNLRKIVWNSGTRGIISEPISSIYSAYGYVVTRRGAGKLLARSRIGIPVDYWDRYNSAHDMKYLCVYPNVVFPGDASTSSGVQETQRDMRPGLLYLVAKTAYFNLKRLNK